MAFKKRPIAAVKAPEGKLPSKVMIATPAYDGRVLSDYALSIAESAFLAGHFNIIVEATILGNGAFIDLARNTLVKLFLESNNDFLFFIDADLRWEARAFVGLVHNDLPICAGVYPKRQTPEEYPATWIERPGGGPLVTQTGDPDSGEADSGWVQCARVPTGFLCIRRDVVEFMVKHSPTQAMSNGDRQPLLFAAEHFVRSEGRRDSVDLINGTFSPTDPVDFIGEDYYFCERYRKLTGKSIPVFADFDFTHGKDYTGNWHQFLMKQSAEVAAQQEVA